ncbi:replicative DNA helicase [Paenibacillus alba]|uniref:DNA 5'-3' helicase n=1 Tax=Paenibacillus alba TaxID=1197127 RepID=A0ABU6GAJ2_9BACL|nr:DnaB-like helicase C-terminal domain-containing protein [Paenibacillus alba]MEC0231167.1 DnaB-like helicase C-terminal domain-containing protein [Paenibacillus alba]
MFDTEVIESQVLGTLLLDPTLVRDTVTVTNADMFMSAMHKNIFVMLQKLNDRNIEATLNNVAIHFSNQIHKVGGIGYLSEMMGSVPSVNQFNYTLSKFLEFDARRKFNHLLETYKGIVSDPIETDFEEILNEFEQKALAIRPKSLEKESRIDGLVDWYEDLELKMADPTRAYGMMTGYTGLDALTLGFQRADFFALGARTSMGKSAFANELAGNAAKKGLKVAMFSLEMNKGQIYNRFVASMCQIPLQDLRTGRVPSEKRDNIGIAMGIISGITINDQRGVTADYIASEMRRMKRQEGLDMVIIDYLQEIMEPSEKNDNTGSALHRVCQKIRIAAKECDCFVLGLSQLKQDIDARQQKRPIISDLSGSAAIGAVADGIILLYRDEYYNPDTAEPGILEVNLAKQRNGPTGLVKLKYDKVYQTITNNYF